MAKSYCCKPLRSRSRWLLGCIRAAILVWTGAAGSDLYQLRVFHNLKNLEYTTEESLDMAMTASNLLVMSSGLLQLVIGISLAIFFACWLYRACANLWAWQIPGVSQKPMWGVWNYVIPFWNIVKPHSFLNELWHAPRWRDGKEPTSWKSLPAPKLLNYYWIFFLVSRALERYARLKSDVAEDALVDDFIAEYNIYLLSDSVSLITMILMYFLVRMIDRRHQEYAQKLLSDDAAA